MQRHRGLLTVVALGLLGVVSLAAAIQVFQDGLPNPKVAGRTDIRDWLSQNDLAAEPRETKLALAKRLELDFRQGFDWQAEFDNMSVDQQRQFSDNFIAIMEVWFREKVDNYFDQPKEDQEDYLDREIENILAWQVVENLEPGPDSDKLASSSRFTRVFDRIKEIFATTPPAEQAKIMRFLAAARPRVIARFVNRVNPDLE